MPTNKKRINLTVSEDLFLQISEYRLKYGIQSDAAACLQLIYQQLNQLEAKF